MRITCKHCKQEVEVPMYFYNSRITSDSFLQFGTVEYKAFVDGKAICPVCGTEIRETFCSTISTDDIIWLATGERR